MKIKFTACNVGDEKNTWTEEYDKDVIDAQKFSEDTIAYFNRTLRPGEKPRQLIKVEVIDETSIRDHDWGKTNLVTIVKGGQIYDTLACHRCGITAKRYCLDNIIIDPKYKAQCYVRCHTSMKKRKI